MLKEGNRMSVPPEAVLASVRPISELRPDFEGGSVLARWLPGLVCREGKHCVETSTGTPLSELPGVPSELAEHSLHVGSDARPVKQPM